MDPSRSSFVATSTTVVVGVEPGLYKMAAAVVPAMPMVFVDHKPSGVGVIVSPKGYVLVPDSLITDADDIGVFINGQLLPASLVGVDSGTGLAVVRVHSIEALTSASFVSDTSVGFGSFVAVIWVDGTGTHSCWGTVSDLDVKVQLERRQPAPARVFGDARPNGRGCDRWRHRRWDWTPRRHDHGRRQRNPRGDTGLAGRHRLDGPHQLRACGDGWARGSPGKRRRCRRQRPQ